MQEGIGCFWGAICVTCCYLSFLRNFALGSCVVEAKLLEQSDGRVLVVREHEEGCHGLSEPPVLGVERFATVSKMKKKRKRDDIQRSTNNHLKTETTL